MPASCCAARAVGAAAGRRWSDDSVDFVVVAGQGVFNNAQRFGRVPFLHPLLADNLDITLVDGRLQDFHLAFTQHFGVVVGGRAAEQEVIALGRCVQHAAGLHLADLFVIERDVGVDIGIEDQAIIGHDLDPGLLRFSHRIGQHRGVKRHDDDDIDTPGNKVFDLRNLLLLVGISRLHEDLGIHFFCRRDEIVTVTRPAFQAQVINGEPIFGWVASAITAVTATPGQWPTACVYVLLGGVLLWCWKDTA